MAKCGSCGKTILFGGKRDGDRVFCNDECLEAGILLPIADQIPEDVVENFAQQVHMGSCPKCNGPGPVDVHTSHRVWSAIYLTSWNSRIHICCRSCGIKAKIGDLLFCGLLGWWGVPFGIILTPIWIIRNFVALFSSIDPIHPSDMLKNQLRLNMAADYLEQEAGQ